MLPSSVNRRSRPRTSVARHYDGSRGRSIAPVCARHAPSPFTPLFIFLLLTLVRLHGQRTTKKKEIRKGSAAANDGYTKKTTLEAWRREQEHERDGDVEIRILGAPNRQATAACVRVRAKTGNTELNIRKYGELSSARRRSRPVRSTPNASLFPFFLFFVLFSSFPRRRGNRMADRCAAHQHKMSLCPLPAGRVRVL